MEQDWDNLLILDGCRFDTFKRADHPEGELRSVVSKGSSTREFLEENFAGGEFLDTVYVSANPQVVRHDVANCFHYCYHLWEDEWDEKLQTVRPEAVTRKAIEARSEYPNKRLIVHYIQPHFPFIGEAGRRLDHDGMFDDPEQLERTDERSVWDRLKSGEIEQSAVVEAYEENLDIVLDAVEKFLSTVNGKSVVTADHGNAFGEMGIYGHPGNHYLDALVKVPWLEIPADERPRVTTAETSAVDSDSEQANERLTYLGYK